MSCRQQLLRGFTLIELIVVLSIAAIISALAAPSFAEMIRNHRLTTQANDILSQLYYARSEAIRRGVQVTIRKLPSSDWSAGWQIFTDTNGNGELNNLTDSLLRSSSSINTSFSLNLTSEQQGLNWIAYLPNGAITSTSDPLKDKRYDLCTKTNPPRSRAIIINPTGHGSVRGAGSCS